MVLTLVQATRMPWITSGLAKRSVTRWPAGTGMHRGTNANWVATMRAVTAPSGPTVVPRLPSANSPFWPSVCGSSGSTWEGGFSARARLLATTTTRISPTDAGVDGTPAQLGAEDVLLGHGGTPSRP